MDGKEGFIFAFIQGWWYRMLVDAKILEAKKACNLIVKYERSSEDRLILKEYIQRKWGVKL